jgi:hypothetical protein
MAITGMLGKSSHGWNTVHGRGAVAIYRMLQKSTFGLEDVDRMQQAYELLLVKLSLTDRNDPITEIVAGHVINVARSGEQSPAGICDRVLQILVGRPKSPSAKAVLH